MLSINYANNIRLIGYRYCCRLNVGLIAIREITLVIEFKFIALSVLKGNIIYR